MLRKPLRWGGVIIGMLAICQCALAQSPATPSATLTSNTCKIFPADNVWNTPISTLPVDSYSNSYIRSIGPGLPLKADWGSGTYQGGPIGIPFTLVPSTQAPVTMTFQYASESDPGPYPFPPNAQIEGGRQSTGDRHVLVIQQGSCNLYETYSSYPLQNGSWKAGSGARWNLSSNTLRPAGWTSADAAGLPILPGLVRYSEVAAGSIHHAIRFTVPNTQQAYIWPARHQASSSTDPTLPPMGQRFRLRASFDISSFSPTNQVILQALKQYGMILADNGSAWFMSGVPNDHWNNTDLHDLDRVHGSDFEAINEQGLMIDPNSGQARQP